MSFVKVLLDEQSLTFFCSNFGKIKDPLSRVLILRAVYDMTIAKLCSTEMFSTLILSIFKEEEDVDIF